MLIGVMSDIHANIKALEAAVRKFEVLGVDKVYVCGDIVGFGTYPNECCSLIRESNYKTVLGNHEWGLLGLNEKNGFHKSIYKHREMLSETNTKWLNSLPITLREGNIEFTHAELVEPSKFNYMHSCSYAYRDKQFEELKGKLCFIGHSHYKELFVEENNKIYHNVVKGKNDLTQYLKRNRAIVSVGSVGLCCTNTKRRNVVVYNDQKRTVKYVII